MSTCNCTTRRLCALSELVLVRIAGADRMQFLQGQLTNDVRRLEAGVLMTAGWCSPKGRLLATPRLFVEGDTVGMIIDAANAAMLVKRLRMYVLRSKVTVEIDETKRLVGVVGEAIPSTEDSKDATLVFTLPSAKDDVLEMLGLPAGRAIVVAAAESPLAAQAGDSAPFWTASAAAGDPWVTGKAMDAFVPQAINLELTGGVSFTKGCYTGQEVVSRVEHIGRTSRRGALLVSAEVLDSAQVPAPMTEFADEAGNPAGVVVYAAAAGGLAAAFVQVSADAAMAAAGTFTIEGRNWTMTQLPYGYERQH